MLPLEKVTRESRPVTKKLAPLGVLQPWITNWTWPFYRSNFIRRFHGTKAKGQLSSTRSKRDAVFIASSLRDDLFLERILLFAVVSFFFLKERLINWEKFVKIRIFLETFDTRSNKFFSKRTCRQVATLITRDIRLWGCFEILQIRRRPRRLWVTRGSSRV